MEEKEENNKELKETSSSYKKEESINEDGKGERSALEIAGRSMAQVAAGVYGALSSIAKKVGSEDVGGRATSDGGRSSYEERRRENERTELARASERHLASISETLKAIHKEVSEVSRTLKKWFELRNQISLKDILRLVASTLGAAISGLGRAISGAGGFLGSLLGNLIGRRIGRGSQPKGTGPGGSRPGRNVVIPSTKTEGLKKFPKEIKKIEPAPKGTTIFTPAPLAPKPQPKAPAPKTPRGGVGQTLKEVASRGASAVGKAGRSLVFGVGKALPLIGAGLLAYDAVQNYKIAREETGEGVKGAAKAVAASAVSTLTFGIIPPDVSAKAINELEKSISQTISKVSSSISRATSSLVESISKILENIKSSVSNAISSIGNFFGNLASGFSRMASSLATDPAGFFKGLAQGVVGFFANIFGRGKSEEKKEGQKQKEQDKGQSGQTKVQQAQQQAQNLKQAQPKQDGKKQDQPQTQAQTKVQQVQQQNQNIKQGQQPSQKGGQQDQKKEDSSGGIKGFLQRIFGGDKKKDQPKDGGGKKSGAGETVPAPLGGADKGVTIAFSQAAADQFHPGSVKRMGDIAKSSLQGIYSELILPSLGGQSFPITQLIGQNRPYRDEQGNIVNPMGYGQFGHMGIDIATPVGTPIYAPFSGVVIDESGGAWGLSIVLIGKNLAVRYSHLSKILVKNGSVVQQGQVIALTGRTGNSTGPHLDITFYTVNKGKRGTWISDYSTINRLVKAERGGRPLTEEELEQIRRQAVAQREALAKSGAIGRPGDTGTSPIASPLGMLVDNIAEWVSSLPIFEKLGIDFNAIRQAISDNIARFREYLFNIDKNRGNDIREIAKQMRASMGKPGVFKTKPMVRGEPETGAAISRLLSGEMRSGISENIVKPKQVKGSSRGAPRQPSPAKPQTQAPAQKQGNQKGPAKSAEEMSPLEAAIRNKTPENIKKQIERAEKDPRYHYQLESLWGVYRASLREEDLRREAEKKRSATSSGTKSAVPTPPTESLAPPSPANTGEQPNALGKVAGVEAGLGITPEEFFLQMPGSRGYEIPKADILKSTATTPPTVQQVVTRGIEGPFTAGMGKMRVGGRGEPKQPGSVQAVRPAVPVIQPKQDFRTPRVENRINLEPPKTLQNPPDAARSRTGREAFSNNMLNELLLINTLIRW